MKELDAVQKTHKPGGFDSWIQTMSIADYVLEIQN